MAGAGRGRGGGGALLLLPAVPGTRQSCRPAVSCIAPGSLPATSCQPSQLNIRPDRTAVQLCRAPAPPRQIIYWGQ